MSKQEITTIRQITLQNALAHRDLVARYAAEKTTPICVSRSLLKLLSAEVAA